MSELKDDKWTRPQKLASHINSIDGWESNVCLTSDGKRLYFSSNREGGLGGFDIYYCDWVPLLGQWGAPVNIGAPINTSANEDAPFIHYDGKTMFFSTDGHETIGGFDVFTSTYIESDKTWSHPTNLGYPINTADDDVHFVYTADGSKGYFSSHRKDSYGERDIYVLKRPNADPNMIVMAGKIVDKDSQEPIEATITVTNLETKQVIGVFKTNKKTGKYVLALNFDVNHSIEIESHGYMFKSENVNVPKALFKFQHNKDFEVSKSNLITSEDIVAIEKVKSLRSKNITLDSLKIGVNATLNNVFFDFDKSELKEESKVELDKLHAIMKKNPSWLVEISGHTDDVGTDEYNLLLSKSRALSVVNYLISKGINPKHLIAVGYGESRPVVTNANEEGRQMNRRTDLTIKKMNIKSSTGGHGGTYDSLKLEYVLEESTVSGLEKSYKLKMEVHFLMNDGANLTPYSCQQLDQVADALKNSHKFKLKLIPSTDLVGKEYNNKSLYDLRAKTISSYLNNKGLAKDRISVKNFVPSTEPIINDSSKADLTKRKVQFLLSE